MESNKSVRGLIENYEQLLGEYPRPVPLLYITFYEVSNVFVKVPSEAPLLSNIGQS